jgi:hypothetical protein
MLLINQSQDFLKRYLFFYLMNSSTKKEARLFNLMKNLRDRKRKKKRKKKNLLSFQGPSPLVCPIITSRERE